MQTKAMLVLKTLLAYRQMAYSLLTLQDHAGETALFCLRTA